jgi:hypothetical protein
VYTQCTTAVATDAIQQFQHRFIAVQHAASHEYTEHAATIDTEQMLLRLHNRYRNSNMVDVITYLIE